MSLIQITGGIKDEPKELLKVEVEEITEDDIVDNEKLDTYLESKSLITPSVHIISKEEMPGEVIDINSEVVKNVVTKNTDKETPITEKLIINNIFHDPKRVKEHEMGRNVDGLYTCFYCDYRHAKRAYTRAHVISMHRPKQKCPYCPYETIPNRLMKAHLRKHEDPNRCKRCDFRTESRPLMIRHILDNHKKFICEKCPDGCRKCKRLNQTHCEFIDANGLKSHMLCVHTPAEQIEWFYCAHCDTKAKKKDFLRKHIMEVHNFSSGFHLCDQCDKNYSSRTSLLIHKRRIHKKKLLKCSQCDFSVYTKISLVNHMVRHKNMDEMEDFKCNFCNYTSKFKLNFKYHIKRHHSSPRVQCEYCPYQTMDKSQLTLHLISKHGTKDGPSYKCKHCNYQTHRMYTMKMHELKHKKAEELEYFYCYHCPFKATRKDNLKVHIFKHDAFRERYICYICNFSAKSKNLLVKHIDKHSRDLNAMNP